MKFDIVTRLRNPPFGTETSERNIMSTAADEIERLREALRHYACDCEINQCEVNDESDTICGRIARAALPKG